VKFDLVIEAQDNDDLDDESNDGLSRAAYERLDRALAEAGFSIEDGPYAQGEDDD